MKKTYRVKILEKKLIAENTLEVKLQKPKDFKFSAGQYILILSPGSSNILPYMFSLASSPKEKHLAVAMRLSNSPFKQKLQSKKIGDFLEIEGTFGTLGLHKDTKIPAVCIAGGIGITPFRSILLDEQNKGFPRNIFLFYCNKNLNSAPYYRELKQIQHPKFQQVHILEESDENCIGEKGLITPEIIKKYVKNIQIPVFYVVGPPVMVEIVKKMLLDMSVPENHIVIERFTGYKQR